jgi:hypothetical protein
LPSLPDEDSALEAALDSLFAAPFPDFVSERKRLVAELRAASHRTAAAALAKVSRPTLASWAINQLIRRARDDVSAMFATAARVRHGDFTAVAEHRNTLARLHNLATEQLREHGQPTSDATLRRIATTLQAVSAQGDFAPDLPGRLIADRDPPGFDAMAIGSVEVATRAPLTPIETAAEPATTTDDTEAQAAAAQAAAAQAAAAQAAAAQAAAARVALARQHAVREEQRTRLRWLAAAILEHEHAIALLHTELERRQDQLRAANQEVTALTSELAHSATGSDERCDSVPPPDGASLPFVSEK